MANRNLQSIFRQCFSEYSSVENNLFINNRLFHNVKITETNAQDKKSFSNASVEYIVGEGLPCYWLWTKAFEEITESYCGENKGTLRECIIALFEFLQDENNSSQLLKVKKATTVAEIQAILSHHLFAPLVSSGSYINDEQFPDHLKKCPACGENLELGDTSFGNYKVWHGHPDIAIDRCLVKIGTENDECVEDTDIFEYELTDPVSKKIKIEDDARETGGCDEGSELKGYNESLMSKNNEVENTLDQVFAQTITNAFYQAKDNPELQNLFIPSFLATDEKVQILMYNADNDRMLKSQDMELFSDISDNGLNNGTVICIWFALNFMDFQQKELENEFEAIRFEKSGFQEKLRDEILSIYQSELVRPLPMNDSEKECRNVKGTAYHLWNSDHTRRMKERLDTLDEKYWTKSHH
ncbi:uncharacterized protein LOC127700658 [Mytilus californianus]|uniref:uncharacterized protein LOC127700658 n=1 Tax=Mytilus californianus TaxID=6549 RepID=UPI0022476A33|nr:uncharacterized protein LOC127700658 [Mytilus californianus]